MIFLLLWILLADIFPAVQSETAADGDLSLLSGHLAGLDLHGYFKFLE